MINFVGYSECFEDRALAIQLQGDNKPTKKIEPLNNTFSIEFCETFSYINNCIEINFHT